MKRPKNFKYWLIAIYYRLQRKRRDGDSPTPEVPHGWTNLLDAAAALGWEVDPQAAGNYVNGHWIGVDHEIVGADISLYVAGYQINFPGAVNLPARIKYQYSDTVVNPGTLLQGAALMISGSVGLVFGPILNPEPPQSEFVGEPFNFQLDCPLTGGGPGGSTGQFIWQPNSLAGAGGGRGDIKMRFKLELEVDGEFQLLQDLPKDYINLFPETIVDNGTDYYYEGSNESAYISITYTLTGEHQNVPYRITVLEYEEVPPAELPPFFSSEGFIAVGISGGEQSYHYSGSDTYPAEYPATAWADGVYTGDAIMIVDPAVPPFQPQNITFTATGPYYDNADTAGVKMNYDLQFEVELP